MTARLPVRTTAMDVVAMGRILGKTMDEIVGDGKQGEANSRWVTVVTNILSRCRLKKTGAKAERTERDAVLRTQAREAG